MKRQPKYYVSHKTPSPIGTVWARLTKYFQTEIEARSKLASLARHYDQLFIRVLMPNNQRKTL